MRRGRLLLGLVVAVAALALVASGVSRTFAAFSGTTSNDSDTVTAKHIFPANRTTTGWDLRDASSGAAVDKSDELYTAGDGLTQSTGGKFPTGFNANDYVDFFFNAPWPAGLTASSATFHMTWTNATAADNLCFNIDVRSASGNSSLGTLNNGGSNWCSSAGSLIQTDIDISSKVTTMDQLNDLDIRVLGQANPTEKMTLDRVWVTASDPYGNSYTSNVTKWNDQAAGTATQTPWALAVASDAGTAPTFTNGTKWPTTAVATKYLQITFPPNLVPSGATINSVTFNHAWSSAGAQTSCYFMTVTSGSGSPYNQRFPAAGNFSPCATSTTNVTRNDALSPVPTAAQLNSGLVFKLSYQTNVAAKTVEDLATITVNWQLD